MRFFKFFHVHKYISLFVLMFFLVFSEALSLSAAGAEYMGALEMFGDARHLGINMYVNYIPDANENYDYVHVNYTGSGGSIIGIATQPGFGYNGRLQVYATFTREGEILEDSSSTFLEYWMSDVSAPEGISLTSYIVERSMSHVKVLYNLEFDNYVAKSDNVYVSFTDNFSQDFFTLIAENASAIGVLGNLFYRVICSPSDWAGSLMEYYDVTEMPGADWKTLSILDRLKDKVGEIKGSITTFSNTFVQLFQSYRSDFTLYFETLFDKMDADQDEQLAQDQQQHIEQSAQSSEQHKEQMEQSSEQHDDLVNGYEQDAGNNDAADIFSDSTDIINSMEDDLLYTVFNIWSNNASDVLDFSQIGLIGYSLRFVATWFSNFWNLGGIFTLSLGITLGLNVISFILKLRR